ncbi:MAG: hypothetical protein GWM98_10750 [Nitrospinaceae bacterium]|nr:hypothetical protein [Nitrospinaceae bacterium]NIR54881.1 hypothetical protein [Nitrospinaceae bacterium]NIS85310.1 hypothetical protein [Nitrospinaceae bacterium]NIT82119.1 hypothetical protein [Nitrospinaceae bacterium]NIU44380.1 hypothetical protein [Nitrospinaceae bacterium]
MLTISKFKAVLLIGLAVFLLPMLSACRKNGTTPPVLKKPIEEYQKDTQKRDDVMRHLVKQTNPILNALAGLEESEKDAVVALMLLNRTVTTYQMGNYQTDPKIIDSYFQQVNRFRPGFPRKDYRSVIFSCLDQSIACASNIEACRKGRFGSKPKSTEECEREDPGVIEACANSSICMFDAFRKLYGGFPRVPGIDPYPGPQPPF